MLEVRPDLVITDLSMPGMDGGALLTAMRENAYLGDTPVLVLSGRPQAEIAAVCEGRATLMRKPAEPQDVLAAVCQWSALHGGYTNHMSKLGRIMQNGMRESAPANARRRMELDGLDTVHPSYISDALAVVGSFCGHSAELNAGNSQTIEFRRGKGTLNAVSVLQMVEFATLLVHFAARMLRHPGDPVGPEEICRYMAENTTSGALRTLAGQQMKGG